MHRTTHRRSIGIGVLAAFAAAVALAVAAGSALAAASASARPAAGGTITIGSKDFTEQFVMGELYAQALQHAGFTVKKKINLGSTTITDAALRKGDIDIYPEYTGTMLLYVCKLPYTTGITLAKELAQDRTCYRKRGLDLMTPAKFNDGNAIACTADFVKKHNVKTLSQLAKVAKDARYATIAEQLTAPNGVPWMKKHYGLVFGSTKTYDVGLRYKALADGAADCVYAFGTDPQIADQKLVVLKDDKGIWPFDHATPVVRKGWLAAQDPKVKQTIDKVNALLTDATMTELNKQVDIDKGDPADVAKAFLKEKGLA